MSTSNLLGQDPVVLLIYLDCGAIIILKTNLTVPLFDSPGLSLIPRSCCCFFGILPSPSYHSRNKLTLKAASKILLDLQAKPCMPTGLRLLQKNQLISSIVGQDKSCHKNKQDENHHVLGGWGGGLKMHAKHSLSYKYSARTAGRFQGNCRQKVEKNPEQEGSCAKFSQL